MVLDSDKSSDRLRAELAQRSLCVRIPGSSANLGPGFDTLGLALTVYNTVRFDILRHEDPSIPLIELTGETDRCLPTQESNHIYQVLTKHLESATSCALEKRIRISIDCSIPIGSGLGSSGTATLAALWAAQQLNNRPSDPDKMLWLASKIEGHPDNVAASLNGGLTISAPSSRGDHVLARKLPWPSEWHPLFVVPARQLSTKDARAVLPKEVPLMDAVHNVQRTSLLLAAVVAHDQELLAQVLDDRLHEPYRELLVPELPELRKLMSTTGAIGTVLSGAGPTVMVLVHRKNLNDTWAMLDQWALKQHVKPRILSLEVDQEGLKPIHE